MQLLGPRWQILRDFLNSGPSLWPSLPSLVQSDAIWYGISLWPVWISSPGFVPSHASPQPPCWQAHVESWKILNLEWALMCKKWNIGTLSKSSLMPHACQFSINDWIMPSIICFNFCLALKWSGSWTRWCIKVFFNCPVLFYSTVPFCSILLLSEASRLIPY